MHWDRYTILYFILYITLLLRNLSVLLIKQEKETGETAVSGNNVQKRRHVD